jgi:hypothetical protein
MDMESIVVFKNPQHPVQNRNRRTVLGCRALAQPKKNSVLDSLAGYIVWGCWELKRKFRLAITVPVSTHIDL